MKKNRDKTSINKNTYIPSAKDEEVLNYIYDKTETMVDRRRRPYRQFNDRNLVQFIDDSEKRVQGYVPSRESQGKTEDQSNVFSQDTRTKLKAIVAAVSTVPPKQKFRAVNIFDGKSSDPMRAEVMKNLVRHSRQKPGCNPEVETFWEAWNAATQGTVVKYDGNIKTKGKRKIIKSLDLDTGEINFEEKEVTIKDEIVDYNVPLREFFVWDCHVKNIQDQARIAWITYKDLDTAEFELGKYKNFKYVKDGGNKKFDDDTNTFMSKWSQRVDADEDGVEIIKYYSVIEDRYAIVANGVLLLDAPMVWGKVDKKYPFSKSIFEPFSSDEFFYGNSLPNINMDVQDVINALWNMLLDKMAYSINKPMVAGLSNKDLLEQEQERQGIDHTIYVEDVSQIKELNIQSLTNGEFAMLRLAQSKMDSQTVSQQQQGMTGKGITARETIIANEHAKEIKGLFFKFLADLWLQKTQLRTLNVLQNYTIPQVREIVGEDGSITYREMFRPVVVENTIFPNGQTGNLQIDIVDNKDQLPTQDDLDIQEEKMKLQGENFQAMAITSSYLDNYYYDIEIVTESVYNQSMIEKQAKVEDKTSRMAALFPQEFLLNKPILFKDWVEAYDDNPNKYKVMPLEMMMAMQQGQQGQQDQRSQQGQQ